MNGYLIKPVDYDDIERLLAGEEALSAPLLDSAVLQVLLDCDDDLDFVVELTHDLQARAQQAVAVLTEALRAEHVERLRDEAHGLKGVAASLGAVRLAESCGRLEQAAILGTRGLEGMVGAVIAVIQDTLPALESYRHSLPLGEMEQETR